MNKVIEEIRDVADMLGPEYTGMMGTLAARMILYDGCMSERKILTDGYNEVEEVLKPIDTETLVESHSYPLAVSALGLYALGRKIKEVDSKLNEIRTISRLITMSGFIGQKVLIESTDPERYKLGTSRMNRYGELDGQSKWHTSKQGVISEVDLSHVYGGWISIKGRFGNVYTTGSLIDRRNDYKPAYEITPLS